MHPWTPVVSVCPVTVPAPGRGDVLQVRVSAPAGGERLPVVVFAHGFGQSMHDYGPLADFWAADGFVVVQPTFLDSRIVGVSPGDERYARIWRIRVDDVVRVIDHLELIAAAVPGLAGRVDAGTVAVAGHSGGAHTASMLLGARMLDARGVPGEDLRDERVRAGVLLALAGPGGDNLTPYAAENFAFMNPDFSGLITPSLMVAGDKDESILSVRGPEWFTEAFPLSPGVSGLLTLYGAEHSLGGISGWSSTETTDENPERVAVVQRLTAAFLRSTLDPGDTGWLLEDLPESLGRITRK